MQTPPERTELVSHPQIILRCSTSPRSAGCGVLDVENWTHLERWRSSRGRATWMCCTVAEWRARLRDEPTSSSGSFLPLGQDTQPLEQPLYIFRFISLISTQHQAPLPTPKVLHKTAVQKYSLTELLPGEEQERLKRSNRQQGHQGQTSPTGPWRASEWPPLVWLTCPLVTIPGRSGCGRPATPGKMLKLKGRPHQIRIWEGLQVSGNCVAGDVTCSSTNSLCSECTTTPSNTLGTTTSPGTILGSSNAIRNQMKLAKPLPRWSDSLESKTDNKQAAGKSAIWCQTLVHMMRTLKEGERIEREDEQKWFLEEVSPGTFL